MKKILIAVFILFSFEIFAQKANHLVIAEIYPGGGNTGATYNCDYIVLYNPTISQVDLSSWSVQYQSALTTTTPWNLTSSTRSNLTGLINAGSYYLIRCYTGDNGMDLPFDPNLSGSISLATTGGKVALVNSQSAISGFGDESIVDFIGWGNANAYEGNNSASAISNNTSSLRRKDNIGGLTYGTNGSGWDSNDNSLDFYKETDISNHYPLPVELTSFAASVHKSKVTLIWSTATEVNNYGFSIERRDKYDGYKEIGFVRGSGNSNSPKNYTFSDQPLGGIDFKYRLKQIDFDGTYEYSNEIEVIFTELNQYTLEQNYPNPFNPTTTIRFSLPVESFVNLKIFNLLGERVVEVIAKNFNEGLHELKFDGSHLASGVYFYQFSAGKFNVTKKFIIAR